MKKLIVTIIVCLAISINSQANTIYEGEYGKIEIQTKVVDGEILNYVFGWIAGEFIAAGAESICSGMGGSDSMCSFVGDVAGTLSGLKRGRIRTTRPQKYTSRSRTATSEVKYNRRKDRGEVTVSTRSYDLANLFANSLASHFFSSSLNYESIKVPRNKLCNQHTAARIYGNSNNLSWGRVVNIDREPSIFSKLYHKGTKVNVGLTFATTDSETINEFLRSSNAFSGYSLTLEQNFGYPFVELGGRYYETSNTAYELNKYIDKSAFINAGLTIPFIKYISPFGGIGYSYAKVTIDEPMQISNYSNSGLSFFGGLDIRLAKRFYLTSRYTKVKDAETFDSHFFEGGLKVRL